MKTYYANKGIKQYLSNTLYYMCTHRTYFVNKTLSIKRSRRHVQMIRISIILSQFEMKNWHMYSLNEINSLCDHYLKNKELRWELIKENKKVWKQEKTLSTKKAINKKRKKICPRQRKRSRKKKNISIFFFVVFWSSRARVFFLFFLTYFFLL